MSSRTLVTLVVAALAGSGAAVIPAAFAADAASSTATVADTTSTDTTSTDPGTDTSGPIDPCSLTVPAGGAAGDPVDPNFGANTATDPGPPIPPGAPDDMSADGNNPNAADQPPPPGTDTTPTSTTDNQCQQLGPGVGGDVPDQMDGGTLDSGGMKVQYALTQGGDITSTLVGGGSSRRAVIAAATVYGSGHKSTPKAGSVFVKIHLTATGRRALQRLHRSLRLTLKSHVVLADGTTVDHSKTVTVKPAKKKRKVRAKRH
jgi:hypothetical protein